MTDSVHPTFEELADLHEGLLSGDALTRVRVHVETCETCTGELASFYEVSAMLAEAGAETIAMPADVAADIDAALSSASLERTAAVPSLAAKREERDHRQQHRRTPWVLVAGAAAAAVVVIGSLGLNGIQSGGDNDDSAGGNADSGGATREQGELSSPNDDGSDSLDHGKGYMHLKHDLTPASLPRFASKLANGKLKPRPVTEDASCQADVPAEVASTGPQALVLWKGQPAVVVVDDTDRKASVFGCGTGAEPLYSTSY